MTYDKYIAQVMANPEMYEDTQMLARKLLEEEIECRLLRKIKTQ